MLNRSPTELLQNFMRRMEERLDQMDQRFGVEDEHFNQMSERLTQVETALKTQQQQLEHLGHELRTYLGRLMMTLGLLAVLGLALIIIVLLRS